MTPAEAWEAVGRRLESYGIPMTALRKGCLAAYELNDILGFVPADQPVQVIEIGSFVGQTACILGLCLPVGSAIVSIDPSFPLHMQLSEAGIADLRPCLAVAESLKDDLSLGDRVAFEQGFFSCPPTIELGIRLSAQGIHYDSIPVVGEALRARGPFDVFVVDGEHSAEAVTSDLRLAATMLRDSGVIIVHDMDGYWGAQVRRGVDEFLVDHSGFALYIVDNLGFITPSVTSRPPGSRFADQVPEETAWALLVPPGE